MARCMKRLLFTLLFSLSLCTLTAIVEASDSKEVVSEIIISCKPPSADPTASISIDRQDEQGKKVFRRCVSDNTQGNEQCPAVQFVSSCPSSSQPRQMSGVCTRLKPVPSLAHLVGSEDFVLGYCTTAGTMVVMAPPTDAAIIAAIVLACALTLIILAVVIYILIKKRRTKAASISRTKATGYDSAYHAQSYRQNAKPIGQLENPMYNRQSMKSLKSHAYEEIGENGIGLGGYEDISDGHVHKVPVGKQMSVMSGVYEEITDIPAKMDHSDIEEADHSITKEDDQSVTEEAERRDLPDTPISLETTNQNGVSKTKDEAIIASDEYSVTFTENELYN